MEETLKNYLFAIDLVNFTLETYELDYRMKLDSSIEKIAKDSPFQEVVGEAVARIVEIEKDFIIHECPGLTACCPNVTLEYTNNAIIDIFRQGYHPREFLDCCGVLCCVAYFSKIHKNNFICDLMSHAIFSLLEAFTFTGEFKDNGGWKELYDCAVRVSDEF